MSPRDISNLPYVARGIADEQKGVDYLRNELVNQGNTVEAQLIGFVLHSECDWIGASPDRIIRVNGEWCLVEVKNWYVTNRQKHLTDLPYLDKKGNLKHSHGHYYQVQTALMAVGLKFCYFVVHGAESCFVIVEYDPKLCEKIITKTKSFHENFLRKQKVSL